MRSPLSSPRNPPKIGLTANMQSTAMTKGNADAATATLFQNFWNYFAQEDWSEQEESFSQVINQSGKTKALAVLKT